MPSFLQGFSQGFATSFAARKEREARTEQSELDRMLEVEKFQIEQNMKEREFQLEQSKAVFEARKNDMQALDFWTKSMDPNNDPAMRRFALREGARRMGVNTDTQHFKEFDKMLAGLRPETLQTTLELLRTAAVNAEPGWLSAMSTAVANDQMTLDEALKQAQQLAQQSQRAQLFEGFGQPSAQQPGAAQQPQPSDRPNRQTLDTLLTPRSLETDTQRGISPTLSEAITGQPSAAPTSAPVSGITAEQAQGMTPEVLERRAMMAQRAGFEEEATFFRLMAQQRRTGAQEAAELEFERSQGPGEQELRKELGKKTGELWAGYREKGDKAASLQQDFEALGELASIAPQGPLNQALDVNLFGLRARLGLGKFNTAGEAWDAIVSRILPTMREPGSGDQSDTDIAKAEEALPALRNHPEANQLILELFRAKAALDMERSDIVDEYSDGLITESEARKKLRELKGRSIMSKQMRTFLDAIVEEQIGPGTVHPRDRVGAPATMPKREAPAAPRAPVPGSTRDIPRDFQPKENAVERRQRWDLLSPAEKLTWPR